MDVLELEKAAENRRLALQNLQRTHGHQQRLQPTFAHQSSPILTPGMHVVPPAQSRDASQKSRYFPASPPPQGNILVPNSSPLQYPSGSHTPYAPYHIGETTAHIPGFLHQSSSWTQNPSRIMDPLSQPSGFHTSAAPFHASLSRPTSISTRRAADDDATDSDRPQKRVKVNDHVMPAIADAQSPPSSPAVQRPTKRRPMGNFAVIHSSDESSPETSSAIAGPSKPRIIRGRPAEVPGPKEDKKKATFVVMNQHSVPSKKLAAAYDLCAGDENQALALASDPTFLGSSPTTTSSSITPSHGRIVGRMKEVEEEREAERNLQRERAKKSHIYKRRADLEVASPAASASTPPAEPESLMLMDSLSSPEVPQQRKRLKVRKRVVDSASEAEMSEDGEGSSDEVRNSDAELFEAQALSSLNSFSADALRELTGCSPQQADVIISLRPFDSVEDLQSKLGGLRKKPGVAGISSRIFQDCCDIYKGYGSVDRMLKKCEQIGNDLKKAIAAWTQKRKGKERDDSRSSSISPDELDEDGTLNLHSISLSSSVSGSGLLCKAPASLNNSVTLKDYQLIGVSWLNLLYTNGLSCILADEMGLGKTVQVITFFAHLKDRGIRGPHLVVVPSSTLENWVREFERFAPSIKVQTYYGSKDDRHNLREELRDSSRGKHHTWEVLITTYNLAVGDDLDRRFFRKVGWNTCVFDEGHVLKNFQSQRYVSLLRINAKWKLLLTGTPLQNNLQELVSLMNFILPEQLGDALASLRAVFKVKGDSKISLLAQERVSRAKKMMTPFVLRRRKDQVLKDLPPRSERIEWCELTALQKKIYNDARQRSRKVVMESTEEENSSNGVTVKQSKARTNNRKKDKQYSENSANVLMDLRKAASHPMLFRTHFSDQILTSVTKILLKEPDFKKRGAIFQYVKEDMEVMTDAELQAFLKMYKSTQKFLLEEGIFLAAGKVKKLLELLDHYRTVGRRCLVFSQFTQVLDILQVILKHKSIKYLILTGQTPVDTRQSLVDEFTEDESIPVFLLSTRAGGMGINLTAASVVILFDQDFNPHNDRQASDRAYRIGQKRDVEIVKLISRGTIEEDMLKLAETKLALDEAVAGDVDDGAGEASVKKKESTSENIMRTSLMQSLRKQFEEEEKNGSAATPEGPPETRSPSRNASPCSSNDSLDKKDKEKSESNGQIKKEDVILIDSDSELTDLED